MELNGAMQVMTKQILEYTNWLFMIIMVFYLFKIIKNVRKQKAKNIVLGIFLIIFGASVELSYHFDQFNKFVRFGETDLEAYLQQFAGFLFALLFLTLGVFVIEFGLKESKLQKEAESNAENRKLLQTVLDTTSHGISYTQHRVTKWSNQALSDMFGWKKEELVGKDAEFLYSDSREYRRIGEIINKQFKETKSVYLEYPFLHKDGRRVTCILSGNMINKSKPEEGYIFSFTDITAYKKALEELAESEEKYRTIIENTDEGYYEVDLKGRITFVNNATINMFNFSSTNAVGKKLSQLMGKNTASALVKVFESSYHSKQPLKNLHWKFKFGEEQRHIETSIIPKIKDDKVIGFRGVSRDITERQKMQEQVAENQRLASLGEMAAGIAHEINNPISGIITYGELLKDELMDGSEQQIFANEVIKEGERIAKIVKNLLAFARKEEVDKSPNDIEEILNDSLALFKAAFKKHGIVLQLDIPKVPTLEFIQCSKHQIQQVFINLISNAIFALNEKYPNMEEMDKIISIKMRSYKDMIRTELSDHGPGMEKDVLNRIFEPFYTTKRPDFGTGLGLSISYGIIKDHRGEIRVESKLGKGTKFTIDLPKVARS
jgi:PAS domain S-box-containing protein